VISMLLVLASLAGACGVVLAAAAAHVAPASGLDSAAYLLLFHAVAVLGAAGLTDRGLLWRPMALVAMAGFVVGSGLFAGDIAMRAFAKRLFPMVAPAGGTLLILAWLVLAVAAIVAVGRTR